MESNTNYNIKYKYFFSWLGDEVSQIVVVLVNAVEISRPFVPLGWCNCNRGVGVVLVGVVAQDFGGPRGVKGSRLGDGGKGVDGAIAAVADALVSMVHRVLFAGQGLPLLIGPGFGLILFLALCFGLAGWAGIARPEEGLVSESGDVSSCAWGCRVGGGGFGGLLRCGQRLFSLAARQGVIHLHRDAVAIPNLMHHASPCVPVRCQRL